MMMDLIKSAYLPLPFRLPLLLSPIPNFYRSTSLYWMHGTDDNVLIYNSAKSGFRLLQALTQASWRRSKFKTFPGLQHGFSSDEILVATNWIEGIVNRNSEGAFDDLIDNLIQPENPIDDLHFQSTPVNVLRDSNHFDRSSLPILDRTEGRNRFNSDQLDSQKRSKLHS